MARGNHHHNRILSFKWAMSLLCLVSLLGHLNLTRERERERGRERENKHGISSLTNCLTKISQKKILSDATGIERPPPLLLSCRPRDRKKNDWSPGLGSKFVGKKKKSNYANAGFMHFCSCLILESICSSFASCWWLTRPSLPDRSITPPWP